MGLVSSGAEGVEQSWWSSAGCGRSARAGGHQCWTQGCVTRDSDRLQEAKPKGREVVSRLLCHPGRQLWHGPGSLSLCATCSWSDTRPRGVRTPSSRRGCF